MASQAAPASAVDNPPAPAYPSEHEKTAKEDTPNARSGIHVIRRNGKVTGFDASKIAVALTKAFLAVEGGSAAASARTPMRFAG